MPDYNWTCHACSSVNEAVSTFVQWPGQCVVLKIVIFQLDFHHK